MRLVLPPIASRFETGHRIRLDLSSSNFTRHDSNPNTGEPEGRTKQRRIARNSVHLGPAWTARPTLRALPRDGGTEGGR